MTVEEICADMSEKAGSIEPLGKTLPFRLDDESMLLDGCSEESNLVSIVTGQEVQAECTVRRA